MQIQRVLRTDPEKVYLTIKNVSGATLTTGMGARYVGGAVGEIVSTDGVQAVGATLAGAETFCGIAVEDIADNGYGRVQVWGYCDSILLSQEADKTIGPSILVPGNGVGMFISIAARQNISTSLYKFVVALNTTNISGGLNYAKAFVRAL